MRRRRLLWHLFPSYLLITVVAIAAVSWYADLSMKHFYYDQTSATLQARAGLLEDRLARFVSEDERREGLEDLVQKLGARSSTRVTVILPSGLVIADSDEAADHMENHADRPEIAAAMSGRVGTSRRFSHTLGAELMYVAVPVERNGEVVGVVRTALPLTSLDEELRVVRVRIVLAAVMLVVFAAVVSLVVSRRLTKPIEAMKRAALRFAHGAFEHSAPLARPEELASLGESMNRMAAELDARIRTVTRQRAEQEAVLSSTVEGVIAIDSDERLITLNRAASEMLRVELSSSRGRPIQEVIRNTDVHEFAALALGSEEPVEREILLAGREERCFQVRGTALRDESGSTGGAVLVLNDVTRTRRLEEVRRDFVANVSHELRTPITSIKGFVETLQDGDDREPGETQRFLGIIAKHADRLNAIIEDLLFLSRIEQGEVASSAGFAEDPVSEVIASALDAVRARALDRRIEILSDCSPGISARMNAQLLEHAVANILDNAIKYSTEGSRVWLSCNEGDGEVVLSVRDEGPGIPEEDLPRIFERFYCVDKARSREMGGTGLGLAIAKHIIQAHGGRICVDSKMGTGSTFRIHLPAS